MADITHSFSGDSTGYRFRLVDGVWTIIDTYDADGVDAEFSFGTSQVLGFAGTQVEVSSHRQVTATLVQTDATGVWQSSPVIAALPGGGYATAWHGTTPGGSYAVYVQIFDSNDAPLTGPIKVFGDLSTFYPDLAVRSDGSFAVLAHASDGSQFISGNGVVVATFSAGGAQLSAPVVVNATTDYQQYDAAIVATPSGGFFAVWTSDNQDLPGRWDQGVYGRFIGKDGKPVGAEITIPVDTSDREQRPSVSVSRSGELVVTWDNGEEVFARIFDRNGAPLTSQFRVNTHTANPQYDPSVSYLANGNFVVTWTSDSNGNASTGQDGDGSGVFGQLFSPSGARIGAEFQVNSTTAYYQWFSNVTALADGGFVVAWESAGQDRAAYAQRFGADGTRSGLEMEIARTEHQPAPTVTEVAPGLLAFGWGEFVNGVVKAHTALIRPTVVRGSDSSDVLTFETAEHLTVAGGAGNDRIVSGNGNDVIFGGGGADTITGGGGADAFMGTASDLNGDVITDLGAQDRIVFRDATLGSFDFSLSGETLTYAGGSLTLSAGPPKQLIASAAPEGGVQLTVGTAPPTLARLVLTEAGQDVAIGGNVRVIGTRAGGETITVLRGTVVLDASFNAGGDILILPGAASTYTARLAGSVVTILAEDLSIGIPVGVAGLSVQFSDAARTLRVDSASSQVMLGEQVITASASPIAPATGPLVAAEDPGSPTSMARLILTEGGQDVEIGGNVRVVGTAAPGEVITVLRGTIVLDASFNQGGDTAVLPGDAGTYSAKLAGSVAIFTSAGVSLSIPVGTAGLQVQFDDASRTLRFDPATGRVLLGEQQLGSTAQPVTPGSALTSHGVALEMIHTAEDSLFEAGGLWHEPAVSARLPGMPEWPGPDVAGGWMHFG